MTQWSDIMDTCIYIILLYKAQTQWGLTVIYIPDDDVIL